MEDSSNNGLSEEEESNFGLHDFEAPTVNAGGHDSGNIDRDEEEENIPDP